MSNEHIFPCTKEDYASVQEQCWKFIKKRIEEDKEKGVDPLIYLSQFLDK